MTTKQMDTFKPLGKLMNVIEMAGYQLEYQYDDLVFINNTAFLFRFDKVKEFVHLHFNTECRSEVKDRVSKKLLTLAKEEHLAMQTGTNFSISQKEESEEIEIKFETE